MSPTSAYLAAVLMLGPLPAYADIYTWIDTATGALNVSNLTPPDDARVLKVVHTNDDPAAATNTQTQALADRVRQLENEIDMAKNQPPPYALSPAPPVVYAPPAPPVIQYFVEAPQPMQYAANPAPAANAWCDTNWSDCGYGNGLGFGWWPSYPSAVVVVNNNLKRFKPGNNFPIHRPRPTPFGPPMSVVQPLTTPIVQPLVGTQGSSFLQTPRMPGFRRG